MCDTRKIALSCKYCSKLQSNYNIGWSLYLRDFVWLWKISDTFANFVTRKCQLQNLPWSAIPISVNWKNQYSSSFIVCGFKFTLHHNVKQLQFLTGISVHADNGWCPLPYIITSFYRFFLSTVLHSEIAMLYFILTMNILNLPVLCNFVSCIVSSKEYYH